MMTFPMLETKRLHLVEIQEEHIDAIYDTFSREEVTQYYGMAPFRKKEQAANMIKSFTKNYEEKRAIRWGIILKETGKLIGTVGLNNLQTWAKKSEIGYDIHPSFWRKGYAYEAAKEVVNYSFQYLQLFRLAAITYPNNIASSSLLIKLGFQKEGVLRGYIFDGKQSNNGAIYAIVKTDWERIFLYEKQAVEK